MTGKNAPEVSGKVAWYDEKTEFGKSVSIGHCSCIGTPNEDHTRCALGDDVSVGAFCIVSMGAMIRDRVKIDHYCRVDASVIGSGTRLLYGARVHDGATVGRDCVIGGNVPDRTIIGDCVMHFGRMAHIPNHGGNWDEDEDPAPCVGDGALIGTGALVIGGVHIGEGAQIGAGAAVIGDGVTIGPGARIGPMCLVRRGVPAGTIVRHNME